MAEIRRMLPGGTAMKNTTDRYALISDARKKYIATGKTINISEAVEMYWKAHPKKCAGFPLTISPRDVIRPRTILDGYERPKCRKCGADMGWQGGCATCKGPLKKNVWICEECGFKLFTKASLIEAISKLKRKEGKIHG